MICEFCENEAVTRRHDAAMCFECADFIDGLDAALISLAAHAATGREDCQR